MFISCFHGRPHVSSVFLDHCSKLGILGEIAAAVTIGDEANISLLDERGVRYVEMLNMPLGAKHNAALSLAIAMGGERFMVLPSDDIISEEWLGVFRSSDDAYASPDRCAVVEVATGSAKVITNRPFGNRNFGAGRFFTMAVVEALGGKVWSDHKPDGLDTGSHGRIFAAGFHGVVKVTERIPICDLKTGDNIWPYSQWKGTPVGLDEALHMAPWVMQALSVKEA